MIGAALVNTHTDTRRQTTFDRMYY